jgi:hypothetical protein
MRRWLLDTTARPVVIREVFGPAQAALAPEAPEPVQQPSVRTLEPRARLRSRGAMMREAGCSPRVTSSSSFSRSTS